MKLLTFTFCCFMALFSLSAYAEETPHLAVATEFIHELAAIEQLRDNANQEAKDAKDANQKLALGIHWSTAVQIELTNAIDQLQGTHLEPPFETLIPTLRDTYNLKIHLHQDMIDIASAMLSGPPPGVNYGKMVADMPKIRAYLDATDHTLFLTTPLVFAILIDQKPDSQNHLTHLVITKAERDSLLRYLSTAFGEKLKQKDQNYIVSSASLLKELLENKDRKCADEPWR